MRAVTLRARTGQPVTGLASPDGGLPCDPHTPRRPIQVGALRQEDHRLERHVEDQKDRQTRVRGGRVAQVVEACRRKRAIL